MLTLNKSKNKSHFAAFGHVKNISNNFTDFKQLLEKDYSKKVVILLTLNNTFSQASLGYLLLTVQHLCYLGNAILHYWPPDASHPPFTASATDLRDCFFTLRHFLPCTPYCCFQGFPGTGS